MLVPCHHRLEHGADCRVGESVTHAACRGMKWPQAVFSSLILVNDAGGFKLQHFLLNFNIFQKTLENTAVPMCAANANLCEATVYRAGGLRYVNVVLRYVMVRWSWWRAIIQSQPRRLPSVSASYPQIARRSKISQLCLEFHWTKSIRGESSDARNLIPLCNVSFSHYISNYQSQIIPYIN